MRVRLPDGTIIEGEEWYQDTSTIFATFDLATAGAAPGLCDVIITNPAPESVPTIGPRGCGQAGRYGREIGPRNPP